MAMASWSGLDGRRGGGERGSRDAGRHAWSWSADDGVDLVHPGRSDPDACAADPVLPSAAWTSTCWSTRSLRSTIRDFMEEVAGSHIHRTRARDSVSTLRSGPGRREWLAGDPGGGGRTAAPAGTWPMPLLSRRSAGSGVAAGHHRCRCLHLARLLSVDYSRDGPAEGALPPPASGAVIGAYGLTEPGAGSDAGGTRQARRADRDTWVLDGGKRFITNAGQALGPHCHAVTGTTDKGDPPRSVPSSSRLTPRGLHSGWRTSLASTHQRRANRPSSGRGSGQRTSSARQGKGFRIFPEGPRRGPTSIAAMALGIAQACCGVQGAPTSSAVRSARSRGSPSSRSLTWPPSWRPRGHSSTGGARPRTRAATTPSLAPRPSCSAGEQLRLGAGDGVVAALVLQPGRPVDECPRGLQLGGHVGDHEGDPLERADRPAELLALLAVRRGRLVGTLGDPEGHRGDRDSAPVEDLQEGPEPFALLAEEVLCRDPRPLEDQLARR